MNYDVKITKRFLQNVLERLQYVPLDTEVFFSREELFDGTDCVSVLCKNKTTGLSITFDFEEYE